MQDLMQVGLLDSVDSVDSSASEHTGRENRCIHDTCCICSWCTHAMHASGDGIINMMCSYSWCMSVHTQVTSWAWLCQSVAADYWLLTTSSIDWWLLWRLLHTRSGCWAEPSLTLSARFGCVLLAWIAIVNQAIMHMYIQIYRRSWEGRALLMYTCMHTWSNDMDT